MAPPASCWSEASTRNSTSRIATTKNSSWIPASSRLCSAGVDRRCGYNNVEAMKTLTIGVIAGDGVGTEVIPQAKRVLETVAQKHQTTFAFQDFEWGAQHFFRWGR